MATSVDHLSDDAIEGVCLALGCLFLLVLGELALLSVALLLYALRYI